jgi:hypothetical protein
MMPSPEALRDEGPRVVPFACQIQRGLTGNSEARPLIRRGWKVLPPQVSTRIAAKEPKLPKVRVPGVTTLVVRKDQVFPCRGSSAPCCAVSGALISDYA